MTEAEYITVTDLQLCRAARQMMIATYARNDPNKTRKGEK